MEQFSLEKYLENPQRKVVTRLKKSVQIISIDGKEDIPIVALVEGIAHQYKPNGYHADVILAYSNQCRDMGDYDLFFADNDELTEFEKQLGVYIYFPRLSSDFNEEEKKYIKDATNTLLNLARKEIEKENSKFKQKFTYNEKDYSKLANKLIEFRNNTPLFSVSYRDGEGRKIILHYEKEIIDLVRKELEANYYTKVLDDRMVFKSELHATDLQTAYDMGKQDALKDLPKWKKATEHKDFEINNVCILDDDIYPVIATNVNIGEYYIELDELKNLPIEK